MSKYDPLYDTLKHVPEHVDDVTLTFAQLEDVLGFRLPASAHKHRAWWANPSTPDHHPYAQAWLGAGWKVDSVDRHAGWVRFIRVA